MASRKKTKNLIYATGLLRNVSGSQYKFVDVTLDGELRSTTFFFCYEQDFSPASCIEGIYYNFCYEQPVRKTLKPSIDTSSWKVSIEIEGFLLRRSSPSGSEFPELYRIWKEEFSELDVKQRRSVFTSLEIGEKSKLLLHSNINWETSFEEMKQLKTKLEKAKTMLQIPSFRQVVTECKNVAQYLEWDVESGTSLNIDLTRTKWDELLLNPYKIAYLDLIDSPRDKKILRKVRFGELSKMDELFIKNNLMTRSDDRRIEYFCQDSIHYGADPLSNQKTCYTLPELYGKMKTRKKERTNRLDDVWDDPDFAKGSQVQSLKEELPADDKIREFLTRVKNRENIHEHCFRRIAWDRGYYYDVRMLEDECMLAHHVAQYLGSLDCYKGSLRNDWDCFEMRFPVVKEMLSTEQRTQILTLLDKSFYMLLGSAGTGKTTTQVILVLFLEWAGFKVYVGTMVGMAAVRAKDVIMEQIDKINESLEKDAIECTIVPKTLCKLFFDLRSEIHKAEKESWTGTVLVLDEVGTVSYNMPRLIVDVLHPDRIYCFGDDKQLLPIRGEHFLEDMIAFSKKRPDLEFLGRLTTIFRGKHSSSQLASNIWQVETEEDAYQWIHELQICPHIKWIKKVSLDDVMEKVNLSMHKTKTSLPPFIMTHTHNVSTPLSRRVRESWLARKNPESLAHYHEAEDGVRDRKFFDSDVVMCRKNLYKKNSEDRTEHAVAEDEANPDEDTNEGIIGKGLVFANGEFGFIRSMLTNGKQALVTKIKASSLSPGQEVYDSDKFIPAYAVTVNKAQGTERSETFVIMASYVSEEGYFSDVGKHIGKRFGYTALTRHQDVCYLFATEEQVVSMLLKKDDGGYRSHLVDRILEFLEDPGKDPFPQRVLMRKRIRDESESDSDTEEMDLTEISDTNIFSLAKKQKQ